MRLQPRALIAASLLVLAACSGSSAEIGSPNPSGTGTGNGSSGESKAARAPSREVPQSTFTGAGAGCSNVLAYRASADGTQYAIVKVDKNELGLEIGSKRTIDLGKSPTGVEVSVDVYASAPTGEKPYCTDYRTESPTVTRWNAQAGKLTIELTADPTSTDAEHYLATMRLESVHFTGPEGGMAVIVPSVVIENVRVGWLPG